MDEFLKVVAIVPNRLAAQLDEGRPFAGAAPLTQRSLWNGENRGSFP
jgi:hypothetical protein